MFATYFPKIISKNFFSVTDKTCACEKEDSEKDAEKEKAAWKNIN